MSDEISHEQTAVQPAAAAGPPPAGAPGGAAGAPPQSADDKLRNNATLKKLNDALTPGYSEPLCGCLHNINGCLLSFCLFCIPAASVKSNLDGRECHILDCICAPSPFQNRQTIRTKYGIPLSPVQDCLTVCCCMPCAVSQDVRELAHRSGQAPQYMKMVA